MSYYVVTGGGSGIGFGLAVALSERGDNVVIFDADEDTRESATELGLGFQRVNVTSPEQLAAAFEDSSSTYGPLVGLVNSAGLARSAPSAELSQADWQLVIDVNLSGTFFACQAAYPHCAVGASIVNIASIASVRALPGRVAYTASKFGVIGVTRVLAVEWASKPIRVNAVAPAWTETAFLADLVAQGKVEREEIEGKIPMKRLATVNDVVKPVLFLLGDESSFVTGQTLFVDGGYTWSG